jgi:ubiquinone/menaquinone biosynthesis C-methylase UbiE
MRRYDLTAQIYDVRYAEEQEAKYKKALESLNIAGNSIILDVGCGTGLLFSHVAAEAQTVVGVDVSGRLLLQAKERARKFPDVNVVQADADHMPFKNDYFSMVFAFTVLQNMPKPLETLKELGRVAKLNALVVVTGLKKIFSIETLYKLLEQAGLCPASIVNDESLKCYVVVCLKRSK